MKFKPGESYRTVEGHKATLLCYLSRVGVSLATPLEVKEGSSL